MIFDLAVSDVGFPLSKWFRLSPDLNSQCAVIDRAFYNQSRLIGFSSGLRALP
jgi:hypothetical protein